MATIEFKPGPLPVPVATHMVYLKTKWDDDWVEKPFLHCESATWESAPSMSHAVLRWRYGEGMREGEGQFATVERLTIGEQFVKIEFAHVDTILTNSWYGIAKVTGEHIGGIGASGVAQGLQRIACYGLEVMLDRHPVITSTVTNPVIVGGDYEINRAIPFNDRGFLNRSPTKVGNSYAFYSGDPADSDVSYHRMTKGWSTNDIVEYLLDRQTPRDGFGDVVIQFTLDAISTFVLPTADAPVLSAHGRTPWQLLNALISRQRLLSFFLQVDEDFNEIRLTPYSFNDTDLLLPGGQTINANPDQRALEFDEDASMRPVLTTTGLDTYNRVVVEGARVRSCFTVSDADATVAEGWPAALETEYETGADLTGLAGGDTTEKRRRHAEYRSADKFSPVYSRFPLEPAWIMFAANGTGGALNPIDPPDMNDPTNDVVTYRHYNPTLFTLSSLPLKAGYDYSGDNIKDGTVTATSEGPHDELKPLAVVPLLEDSARYVQLDAIGTAMDLENTGGAAIDTDRNWSASVFAGTHDRSIFVRVHGAPQHMIAAGHFSGQSEDYTPLWDYDDMIFTVAIETDRHVQAIVEPLGPPTLDYIQTLHIDAGDDYRLDYVVPQTVIGVADDGTLVRSSGGYVRNDWAFLRDLGTLAFQWYSVDRNTLEFATSLFKSFEDINEGIRVGDLVTTISTGDNERTINTVVTSITASSPVGEGGRPNPVSFSYRTGFAQLDVLKL